MNLKFLPVNIPSPFETHCDIMTMFIITILVYGTNFHTSFSHEIISKYISLLSGSLAPALLALILFPGYLGRLILLVWTIYFVKLTYDAWRKLYQLYNTISSVSDFLNQLLGRRGLHNEESIPYITSSSISTATHQKHAILGLLIAVFLALLPLKFASMNTTAAPFETHSAILSKFVITTLVYAVAWAIETKLETRANSYHHAIISNISLLVGSLATVLLVLILVPGLGRRLEIQADAACVDLKSQSPFLYEFGVGALTGVLRSDMELLFSKTLTATDVQKRLSIPFTCLKDFEFHGSNSAHLRVEDQNGSIWPFALSTRKKGYPKPIFSKGWLQFVRCSHLCEGDRVEFYKDTKANGLYRIQVQRCIKLFGKKCWVTPPLDQRRVNFEEGTEAAAEAEAKEEESKKNI
ncbi:Uncharacterized protein TCM_042510 [Theobroma cacao]|uniref:TF-B3 domain-containing protein n=1 Tax=Theobroma cacao TaxID=3641 RepID=A0A061FL31_THECC|nr:Uncharacterized protein TCM_042510 [Theobroma cacao]